MNSNQIHSHRKIDIIYIILALFSGVVSLRWRLNSLSKLDAWIIGTLLLILSFFIFKRAWKIFFIGIKNLPISGLALIFVFLLVSTVSFKEVFWRYYIDKWKCLQFIGASIGNLFLGVVFLFSLFSIKDFPNADKILKIGFKIKNWLFNLKLIYFLIMVFSFSFIASNLLSYFVLEHIPHIQDSICYLFQAKIFQIGKLFVQSHPHKEFFDFLFMINDSKWYSQYQWGHPFLLFIGLLIGMPWIVNPFLGSISVVIIYFIAREVYDEGISRLATILTSISPFILFMDASFMAHTGTMLFIAIFILSVMRTFKTDKWIYPLIAGLSLGFSMNIRILTASAAAFPLIIYFLYKTIKCGPLKNWKKIFFFAIGFIPFFVAIFIYNYLTTGNPLLFGYIVFNGDYHNYGFGTRGMAWYVIKGQVFHKLTAFNPLTAFFNRNEDIVELNNYLFELPIPSILFILVLFLSRFKTKWDYLFISPLVSLSIFYYFYFFQSITFGPRFLYESLPGIMILSAKGIKILPDFIKSFLIKFHDINVIKKKTFFLITIAFLLYLAIGVPYLIRFYSVDYWEVTTDLVKLIDKEKIKNALIFVKFDYDNEDEEIQNIYGSYHYGPWNSAFLLNSPLLDTDIIFARDMGQDNHILKKYYSKKQSYIYHPLDNKLEPI
jgi:hypothetical protein